MIELFVAITGLIAIALALSEHEMARHGSVVFGLVGQPFWLEYFWRQNEMAFFIVSVAMTAVWVRAGYRGCKPLCQWLHAWWVVLLWEIEDGAKAGVGPGEGPGDGNRPQDEQAECTRHDHPQGVGEGDGAARERLRGLLRNGSLPA